MIQKGNCEQEKQAFRAEVDSKLALTNKDIIYMKEKIEGLEKKMDE